MRLLSYNIHKGIGGRDRRYRIERVVDVIESENPDLVCLQEVDRHVRRTRHDDQPGQLAKALNAAATLFQLNVHLKRGGGYGNLVLSRWPFRRTHQVSLRHRRRRPRGAQLAVVETPEGPLHLIHWHLGLGERERHWQVGHLLDHPHFRESGALPTLVVGDFNDWRNTLAHGPLARHGFHQVTAPRSRFRSFPANFPVLALDKAFLRGSIEVRHARIVHSAMARVASDHLPLVVDFHLRGVSTWTGLTVTP
jgi:endonuclease/exonuclease/phosphatase family metal-dependent hydrolase